MENKIKVNDTVQHNKNYITIYDIRTGDIIQLSSDRGWINSAVYIVTDNTERTSKLINLSNGSNYVIDKESCVKYSIRKFTTLSVSDVIYFST